MGLSITLKKLLLGRAFETERGRIRLFGKMDWTLIPSRAVARNFQEIAEEKGPDFLYRLGYEAGKDAAEEMTKFMGFTPKTGWTAQKAVLALLEFIGFGRVKFVVSRIEKDGQHHFVFHVYDNPVIEHARNLFGEKSMVCNWFMGVYAAHGEMEMGIKKAKIRENKCVCRGAPYCEWETKWQKKGERT
jgi:predicted hydrocarbon binding protein